LDHKRAHHSEMEHPVCLLPANRHTSHELNKTHEVCNRGSIDLGMYYIDLAIDAMEEWHSKPTEGYHVIDVCLCPRQKVFREIDRRPIGARTGSIYAVGKATHEAYQSLYGSDRRAFEIEKYVEIEDVGIFIQGSVDIYDRRRIFLLKLLWFFYVYMMESLQTPFDSKDNWTGLENATKY
jgi:hypothetical protein